MGAGHLPALEPRHADPGRWPGAGEEKEEDDGDAQSIKASVTPLVLALPYPLQAGGLSRLHPSEACKLLWGFATLGVQPARLLGALPANWAWQQPLSPGPGGGARAATPGLLGVRPCLLRVV